MERMRLIHYFDVWGNAKEGYEINNLCEEAIIDVPDGSTDAELLKALKRIGFIKMTARVASLRLDYSCADTVEITDRNGLPLGRLESLRYEIERFGANEYKPYHKEYRGIIINTVWD